MPRYMIRWLKDRYKKISLRKDVFDKLKYLKSLSDRSYSDLLDEIINVYMSYKNNMNIMNTQVSQCDPYSAIEKFIDEMMTENSEYIEKNFKPDRETKLIPYPAGDFYIFDDLNKYFMISKSKVFVEVFGGSCWSSINVSRQKFKVIVCNDIDNLLINIFNMIKNTPDLFLKRLSIMPISREMREIGKIIIDDPKIDIITKTIMMFYVIRTSMFGIYGRSGFAVDKSRGLANRILGSLALVKEYSKKIRDITFESKDFREILKIYDSDETLFYLDPPYVSTEKTHDRETFFRFSFSLADLKSLANSLRSVKADFVLKISEDNYKLIEKDLPDHDLETLETIKNLENVLQKEEPERKTWRLMIVHNIKRKTLSSSLVKYIK